MDVLELVAELGAIAVGAYLLTRIKLVKKKLRKFILRQGQDGK